MKLSYPQIRKSVPEKWLEKCDKKLLHFIDQLETKNYFNEGYNLHYVTENLTHRDFKKRDLGDIKAKHTHLIQKILKLTSTVGIYKSVMIKGTIEPVISLRIYGYYRDVEVAMNLVKYFLDGTDLYYLQHVKELNRKRDSRRRRGVKLRQEMDARKRTNQNIKHKYETLVNILQQAIDKHHSVMREGKISLAIDKISNEEKIDYKQFRGMKTKSIRSMYARRGKVILNRLV